MSIFVCDTDGWHFQHLHAILYFMTTLEWITEHINVGLRDIKKSIDLTTNANSPNKHCSFILQNLCPFQKKRTHLNMQIYIRFWANVVEESNYYTVVWSPGTFQRAAPAYSILSVNIYSSPSQTPSPQNIKIIKPLP